MNDELKFTVISDSHYYLKKNFVDGFDKNKKPKPDRIFFSRSEQCKKLNSIGLSSISEAVLPLVNRGADSDSNAAVYFGE